MSESQKQLVNGAALTVISTVLAVAVAFLCWTARTVYELNAEIAAMKQHASTMAVDLKDIKDRGSPAVQAIMARLDNLTAGQARIEKALEDHMKTTVKP